MTAAVQAVILFVSLSMLSYGLWLISPASMFIGVGSLLLLLIIVTRLLHASAPKRS
jgi:hypothetical protein